VGVGVAVGVAVGVTAGVAVGVAVGVATLTRNALLNVVVAVMSAPLRRSTTPSVGPLASDQISYVPMRAALLWNVIVPSWVLAPAGKPMPEPIAGNAADSRFSIRDPVSVVVPYLYTRKELPGVLADPVTASVPRTSL
jgi:hypothetical protein